MQNHAEKLAVYFLHGDEQSALSFIQNVLKEDNRLTLYDNLLAPAMVHIGRLWERNEITVADEHLATAVCDFIISDYEFKRRQTETCEKKVMLFGVEGEQHYLGLKMAAAIFKEHGWTVRYLGPNLPLQHAETAVNSWEPEIVAISAALSYRLPAVKKAVHAFTQIQKKPQIFIGGRIADRVQFEHETSDQVYVMENLQQLKERLQMIEKGEKATDVISKQTYTSTYFHN